MSTTTEERKLQAIRRLAITVGNGVLMEVDTYDPVVLDALADLFVAIDPSGHDYRPQAEYVPKAFEDALAKIRAAYEAKAVTA